MTTQIKVADVGDVAAVRDFARRVVGPHYTSIGLPEFGESMLASYWDNDGQVVAVNERRVLLAMDNGMVVGVAEFGDYEGELVLWKLYIDEAHRGAGIGQALIDRVIESAPAPTESLLIEHVAENVAACGLRAPRLRGRLDRPRRWHARRHNRVASKATHSRDLTPTAPSVSRETAPPSSVSSHQRGCPRRADTLTQMVSGASPGG